MASKTERHNKKTGKVYYEIRVSRGRGVKPYSMVWHPPEGWSKRSIKRELDKVASEYERACRAGEILTKEEKKAKEVQEALEAAQVLSLRQYGESVYMAEIEETRSESTRSTYQTQLDKHIYPALGDYKLKDITPAQIEKLFHKLRKEGKAHGSLKQMQVILKGIFKKAYKGDLIDSNPMDKVDLPAPRKGEKVSTTPQALTAEQVVTLKELLSIGPLKWDALFNILIDTGMRVGECCALQWKDIDLSGGGVEISKTAKYTKQKGVYTNSTKTGTVRGSYIQPGTISLLRHLRAEQAETGLSHYVFPNTKDAKKPIIPQTAYNHLENISSRSPDLPRINPHMLRHTFVSLALVNNADLVSVSKMAGHSNTSTTLNIYAHATEESKKAVAGIVQDAIKKAGQV